MKKCTPPYAEEEVHSTYTYPKEYYVKSIYQQIKILKKFFPGLDYSLPRTIPKTLPTRAEGLFIIPRWQKIAPTYCGAVAIVLDKLASTRELDNHRENKLGKKYLRQNERTSRIERSIGIQQPGDIMVIPAQFGLRHRGQSFRRARKTLRGDEFGLGTFAAGCMLLTHPERFTRFNQLYVYVLGDEYDSDRSGRFLWSPLFSFSGCKLGFGAYYQGNVVEHYGAVTGFRPDKR